MKVLITGAAGMLGSALLRTYQSSQEHEVLPLTRADLDLRSRTDFEKQLKNFAPDLVIHAAAKVGGIQANISHPVEFLADNLQMDSNIITTSLTNGVENLLYIGSSCMYPRDYRQPLVEGDLLQAPLEPTNEGYAIAKIAGSKLCEYASSSLSVNYKTIIPSNLYGPGDNFKPGSSHLLASVIRKVHEVKLNGSKEIDVWGSGNARREFTYIDDLSEWIAGKSRSLDTLPPVLNVGIGIDYSINEFYQTALDSLGVIAELKHDLSKPEGMQSKLMDSSLARKSFGWNPKTELRTGIAKTYDWFLANSKEYRP
jgi:GDP-L-fucose synthase